MAEKPNDMERLDFLTTWGENGNISVVISQGYPRFTFFQKGDKGNFITVSLDVKTLGVIGKTIRRLAKSNEDVKYSISRFNKDNESSEKVLAGVLVLAKRGEDIYVAIKRNLDAPANTTKIEIPKYHALTKNGEPSLALLKKYTALAYSDLIEGVVSTRKFFGVKNTSQEEGEPVTEIESIDMLTTWGGTGNLVASIKNGYPRFTFFQRSDRTKFITAPMDIKTFGAVGYLIRDLAASNTDLRYELECKNLEKETKKIFLQAILVLARINNSLYIGIKKDHTSPDNLTKIDSSDYIKLEENSTEIRKETQVGNIGYLYADAIRVATLCYKPSKANVPNSMRKNQSNKPSGEVTEYSDVDL